eukprot:XP_011676052.1 PREDICTED: plexin-B1 isoform X1 [Strongylocentrotus purpuratus]
MKDIQDKFVDATCGCVTSLNSTCNGTKVSYLTNSACAPLAKSITREAIENNLQCVSSYDSTSYKYAQATIPLMGNPLAADLPGQSSSIVTLSKGNEIVALVTTSTASAATLSKIHVQPDNTGRLYETITFDVGGIVLHDVHINQDSEELYILTTEKLMQLAVINCSQYSSCDECLGPTNDDGDPFCGWCTLETKCSRSNECSDSDTDPLNWLQYNQDCIAINNLDPPSQDIVSASRSVSFSVSQLPSIQSGSEYTCRFDDVVTDTTINGTNFTCMTPAEGVRPAIPDGENSVTMKLGIHSSLTDNIIVVEDFDFFECSAINSCSECVMSDFGCDWCVFGGGCTLDGSSSCTALNDIIVNAQDSSSCPQLKNVSTEILIPVGLDRAILLTGSNIPSGPEVDYKCILSKDGTTFREVGVSHYNSTSVEWQETVYDYDPSDGLEVQVSIRVEYMAGFSLDNQENTVTLYNCSVSGVNCRSCVTTSIRAELGCGWCTGSLSCQVNATDEQCDGAFFGRGQSNSCPAPQITKLFPVTGPVEGNTTLTISGTNLPAEENETVNITVAGVECSIIDGSLNPGISINCSTGSSDNQTLEGVATVVFVFGTAVSDESFIYRNPKVTGFSPLRGIRAGGTEMNITGEDLATGRVIRVSVGEAECNIMENGVTPELIQCQTGSGVNASSVIVSFDGAERVVPGEYSYVSDPVITGYTPKESIMSGGIELTVSGSGFFDVQTAILQLTFDDEVIYQECSVNKNDTIYCLTPDLDNTSDMTPAPSRRRREATSIETAFLLDGLTVSSFEDLSVHPDPVYEELTSAYVISSPGEAVTLRGENLMVPLESTEDFVTVCMGKGECDVTEVTTTSLACLSPIEQPENGVCKGDDTGLPDALNIVVFHGNNLRQVVGQAQYDSGSIWPAVVGGVVGGVVVLSIVIFLAFVCVGHRNYKAQIRNTEMEMENLMQHSRREVMTGFFIDQEMTDIEEQLRGLGMPFVSNHDYMKSMLFFGLDVKPVTTEPEIPSEMEQRAMLEFSKLISNKDFLIVFIHTLDSCKQISTKEKANIASLLTVVLVMEGKFRYFTDVLMTLMSETIGEAADRQRLKQLFKRTETLEDKLLNNWIALAMFKFIKESVSQPLYKLYQAIKIQCEKGPVDAATGQSYFSLSFDNLLTESPEFEEVTLNVESELGQESVKVLNVDTITQVKEKILDAMYRKKHTKYQRSAREVDLVLKSGGQGELIVSDFDTSTTASMGWCPINTLQHYGISSGVPVSLTDKKDMPNAQPVPMNNDANNLFTLFPEFHKHSKDDATRMSVRVTGHHEYFSHDLEKGPKDVKYYHLVQSEDSDEQDQDRDEGFFGRMQRVLCFKGTQGRRKIREIYLQRLVSVKQSINGFVNEALDAMFTIQEDGYENNMNNIPFALRFLFNFFDEEASRYDDDGTAATWKNNTLPLRFWATILAHPSFIFNMRQSRTADTSVTVLNQMLDNACKGVVPTLKMNSSPSRLLFNKELPAYISLLTTYYDNINKTLRLEEDELKVECQRIDEEFTGLFSRLTSLKQLYSRIRPHETMLVEALQEDEICSSAHFASSLERVGNTLDQHED